MSPETGTNPAHLNAPRPSLSQKEILMGEEIYLWKKMKMQCHHNNTDGGGASGLLRIAVRLAKVHNWEDR